MKKWIQTHPKSFWGSLVALIVVVVGLVAVGLWHNHTQQQATAKVDQALTATEAASQKLDAKVAKHWAKPNVYIKSSTTAQQLNALKTSNQQLIAKVKVYRAKPTATTRKRLQQLDAAQAKRSRNLSRLQKARLATRAVNALVMPEALVDTKVDDTALIIESTNQAALTKAKLKVADANSELKQTLTKVLSTCEAQLKERDELKKAIAKISNGGTLNEHVTLAELKAFQAFLKQMTYPKLAEGNQTLIQGVQKAIDAQDTKKIPLTELQRRAFFAYSEGKDLSAAYVDQTQSHFEGDTYIASIWGIYASGTGLSAHEMAMLKISRNGDYTMTGRGGDKRGNIFADITKQQLDAMRADVTKGKEPKAKPLTEIFASAQAFYDWAIAQLPDAHDPHFMTQQTNTKAEFSLNENDELKDFSVDAVYDVEFDYGTGQPEVDAQIGHFGRLVLTKDGKVYTGMPLGVLGLNSQLTADVQRQIYTE
ncbi:hypothetical protein [Lacticaseibacillus porcinae]|uniref:hypothetical protein n=1 Tax=Lacticaseibacillus porcinae TaxID=1123687 RepID=UPI000F7B02CD|nr:hypothetical protein [Lacticaseibacillus porcinae]